MSSPIDDDVATRRFASLIAIGAALMPALVASAIAGLLIGGIGGRLAMYVLRLTSGPAVLGTQTDDGFVIGEVTMATAVLIAGVTIATTLSVGPAFALARGWLPPAWRSPTFALVLGLVGGGTLVHADGIDFRALTPQPLAVALFAAVPAGIGLMLEPLHARSSWARRTPPVLAIPLAIGLSGFLALGAAGVVALPVVGVAWLLIARVSESKVRAVWRSGPVTWLGRGALLVVSGLGARELASDLAALF